MEQDIVIDVKNISKKYTIATDYQPDTLRDKIVELVKYPLRALKGHPHKPKTKEYWALKNISFQVKRGEVLGIIGKNGAGKSTLLKILSRITEPTSGEIQMKGRVASLLEVGTGFNPELTGRENIYLNGAIIGMSKREINSKFEEIVAFSGIGGFLDTPVKRYSSGMYVRLAFAVSAHLDCDILLLDEVLAVGDVEFQKKCIEKMKNLAESGRTVLFISHNIESIREVCNRVIIISGGTIGSKSLEVELGISQYISDQTISNPSKHCVRLIENSKKYEYFTPTQFYIKTNGNKTNKISSKDSLKIVIEGFVSLNHQDLTIGYALYAEDGRCIYWSYPTDMGSDNTFNIKKGRITLSSSIPVTLLNIGVYRVELIGGIHNQKWIFQPLNSNFSIYFEIIGNKSSSKLWTSKRPTVIAPLLKWDITYD